MDLDRIFSFSKGKIAKREREEILPEINVNDSFSLFNERILH